MLKQEILIAITRSIIRLNNGFVTPIATGKPKTVKEIGLEGRGRILPTSSGDFED